MGLPYKKDGRCARREEKLRSSGNTKMRRRWKRGHESMYARASTSRRNDGKRSMGRCSAGRRRWLGNTNPNRWPKPSQCSPIASPNRPAASPAPFASKPRFRRRTIQRRSRKSRFCVRRRRDDVMAFPEKEIAGHVEGSREKDRPRG